MVFGRWGMEQEAAESVDDGGDGLVAGEASNPGGKGVDGDEGAAGVGKKDHGEDDVAGSLGGLPMSPTAPRHPRDWAKLTARARTSEASVTARPCLAPYERLDLAIRVFSLRSSMG